MRISPFENVALVPAESLTIGPVLALTGIAAACLAAGLVGYRRRDIPT
jgi:ABC-2 type transport system permease protein